MVQLTEFVGHCYRSCRNEDIVEEYVVRIVASCKSEVLGMLLDKYPKTSAWNWNIYGGHAETASFGNTDVILESVSSYWG